jgi:hypothetical protein
VSYLNTWLSLLSINCTDVERATIIVEGIHGLHLYANHFWYRHLLAYAAVCAKRHISLSQDFIQQLDSLLRFCKNDIAHSSVQVSGLEILDLVPAVKELVSRIISFRESLKKDYWNDKTPQSKLSLARPSSRNKLTKSDISSISCTADSTQFSSARHHYQLTVELLLSPDALLRFPGIDANIHRRFVENYADSAFVCRFVHCSFSSNGFPNIQERSQHESRHQRKYRGQQPKCFSSTGFASNAQLTRQNDKYHPVITNEASLTEAIKALTIEDHRNKSSWRPRLLSHPIFKSPVLKRRKGTQNLTESTEMTARQQPQQPQDVPTIAPPMQQQPGFTQNILQPSCMARPVNLPKHLQQSQQEAQRSFGRVGPVHLQVQQEAAQCTLEQEQAQQRSRQAVSRKSVNS